MRKMSKLCANVAFNRAFLLPPVFLFVSLKEKKSVTTNRLLELVGRGGTQDALLQDRRNLGLATCGHNQPKSTRISKNNERERR